MTDLLSGKGNIVDSSIVQEIKKSYLDYAMSVIVARALPDARDGLKPVHRRILYSMHETGCFFNRPYKKSARIVGDVIGKYHPHGDKAIYDSLVRMAQPFSMGLVLVDGQGNFGSVDKDEPAAMRYTESRLEKVSHFLLDDLDKDSVNFATNYDGSELEPTVLPAKFPNLFVNGSEGIAVGMATSIPPHNLGEMIDASLMYIDNPSVTSEELITAVPAPDFPTGALIISTSGIKQALTTGRGAIRMRSKTEIEEMKGGKSRIVVTEIPYQVVKSDLVETIAGLVREKKIEDISEIRDESNKDGMRIVIETKRDADPHVILNQLLKFTQLETNFSANMLALSNGRPEMFSLRSAVKIFCEFREEVVVRRSNYLLNKTKNKAHLLIGLCVAVDSIDEIVSIIRSSANPHEAKERILARDWSAVKVIALIALIGDRRNEITNDRFKFTEEQVRSILEMRLSKLTALERDSIVSDLNELAKEIKKYVEILTKRHVLIQLIKSELLAIKEEFAVPRRSEITHDAYDIDMEDLIQWEEISVSYTLRGYIKKDSLSQYNAQKRGGKGKSSMRTSDDDTIVNVFSATTHSLILFFSDLGRVYRLKGYKIPSGSANSKGRSIVNLLKVQPNEKVNTFLPLPESKEDQEKLNLIFVTNDGFIRRSSIGEFDSIPSSGKIAISLSENKKLIGVKSAQDTDHVLLATRSGQAIRFAVSDLRVIKSRSSTGVLGIRLPKGDEVCSVCILSGAEQDTEARDEYLKVPSEERRRLACLDDEDFKKAYKKYANKIALSADMFLKWVKPEEFLLTITSKGYGKLTSSYEYRITNRGGKGIRNILVTNKNGLAVNTFIASAANDIIILSSSGKMVRCNVGSISTIGRSTQGVKVMSLDRDESIVAVERVMAFEEGELDDDEESGVLPLDGERSFVS